MNKSSAQSIFFYCTCKCLSGRLGCLLSSIYFDSGCELATSCLHDRNRDSAPQSPCSLTMPQHVLLHGNRNLRLQVESAHSQLKEMMTRVIPKVYSERVMSGKTEESQRNIARVRLRPPLRMKMGEESQALENSWSWKLKEVRKQTPSKTSRQECDTLVSPVNSASELQK